MKKILAILTAVAAIGTMTISAFAANDPTISGNTVTVYATKDGDVGGGVEVSVTGTAAVASYEGSNAVQVENRYGFLKLNAKAGDVLGTITFTGTGTVTITGATDDLIGVSLVAEVGGTDNGAINPPADSSSDAQGGGNDGGTSDNTKTGVVIAIVPMALAAAAAAVSKKK